MTQSTDHIEMGMLLRNLLKNSRMLPVLIYQMAGVFEEIQHFQEYLSDYKISVFNGMHTDRIMFSGNSLSAKKLYFLFDRDSAL